ncbi:hypothetical protein GGS20DRAFT_228861 [Poronia punctata]|nr:hypothetical protein GGS20DRAFT_228861 [Poronia punctata]
MQPSRRMHITARVSPPPPVFTTSSIASKRLLLPTLAWLGAASFVGMYISRQLQRESGAFDHIFAQQNTPEVEAARRRHLQVETFGDPRNSLLNVLGWTK